MDYYPSIKKENLPKEFSDLALETINKFIEKTYLLDYECMIYFDYMTGETLKCAIGKSNKVKIKFKKEEFEGHHVASLHNHPSHVFSPPSGKNVGILARDFEDYELISGQDELWILEAKGLYEYLISEMNIASELFFNSCLEKCSKRYNDKTIIDKMVNLLYGNQISTYINKKNLNGIQLTKKEYVK